jgi:NAD(P)-dependent dehydrogenase (short-subunit alcohol dehydrogenase family)
MVTSHLSYDEYAKIKKVSGERRFAIVTGGTGRIGSLFVNELLDLNYDILILSRTESSYISLLERIPTQHHSRLDWLAFDLNHKYQIKDSAENILSSYQSCNVLVNCASNSKRGKYIDYSVDSIEEEFWGAIMGTILFTELILPIIRCEPAGLNKIINVSSLWGSLAPNFNTYLEMDIGPSPVLVAAKFALNGYTKHLASREASKGIICNALAPGFFPRPSKNERLDYVESISEKVMKSRIGNLADLVPSVQYLLSDSTYTTGNILTVDGGYSSW